MCGPISLTRAVFKGASIFYSPEGADKVEWLPIVFSNRPIPLIYRLSSWGFSLVGVLILTFANAMIRCDPGLWWRTIGVLLCVQGWLSYMADVYTWGRRDRLSRLWKSLDVYSAACLTSVTGPVVCCRMLLGYFLLEWDLVSAWSVGVMLALFSKIMGAREARKLKDASCERLLLWHTGWHALPFMGVFLVVIVVLRARDEMAAEIVNL